MARGSRTSAKQALLAEFAAVGKAIGSPARLELLDLVAQGEKSVDTLALQSGRSVTNTSNHLRSLRMAGLVATRRAGTYVYYRLADPAVHDLLRRLQEVARRRSAQVREIVGDHFDDPAQLEPIGAAELRGRLGSDDVVVLDVRPGDEYEAGHIPGAISVPIGELEQRLSELPPDREVIAYCRGPYCVLALEAVDILRASGRIARRLEDGIPDWRARGLEVAV